MAMVVGWRDRVRECECARMYVRTCVRDVFAKYDNNTLPRLIMIIIKTIFLYFIEIALTDDYFPSTGSRHVTIIFLRTSITIVRDSDKFIHRTGNATTKHALSPHVAVLDFGTGKSSASGPDLSVSVVDQSH